ERVGEVGGVMVVDDYAHHPTEVQATLAAARQAFPRRRVVAVFQPHLFSRTALHGDALGRALAAADVVVVAPIYGAREQPLPGVSAALVARGAVRAGATTVALRERATLTEGVAETGAAGVGSPNCRGWVRREGAEADSEADRKRRDKIEAGRSYCRRRYGDEASDDTSAQIYARFDKNHWRIQTEELWRSQIPEARPFGHL